MLMYSMTVKQVQDLLKKEDLLREVIINEEWRYAISNSEQLNKDFTSVSYFSKEATEKTLFICKGKNFKREYLEEALDNGVSFFVAEEAYETQSGVGFIVSDVRIALAVLSRAFYDFPDKKLKMVGVTGTKGKTTTVSFIHQILNEAYPGKAALLSSIYNSVEPGIYKDSDLTTPESLDLYRLLAQAVENGLEYAVAEVSSQGYKMKRVYGLYFDIGIFLNISPDHVGTDEHPDLEDYLFCKRELLHHSKKFLLYNDTMYLPLLLEEAQDDAEEVYLFGEQRKPTDYYFTTTKENSYEFNIHSTTEDSLNINGRYRINLPGDFNKNNVLAAVIATSLLGVAQEDAQKAIPKTSIPGRMEEHVLPNGAIVYIDFAHNYESFKQVLRFFDQDFPDRKKIIITGASSNSGEIRRRGMAAVFNEHGDKLVLTSDDPKHESPRAIAQEIAGYISRDDLEISYEENREQAIRQSLEDSGDNDLILVAGKGGDTYQDFPEGPRPYKGDINIVNEFIQQNK